MPHALSLRIVDSFVPEWVNHCYNIDIFISHIFQNKNKGKLTSCLMAFIAKALVSFIPSNFTQKNIPAFGVCHSAKPGTKLMFKEKHKNNNR